LLNGVRLIAEEVPGVNTVGLACYIACGSSDDPEGQSGMAHLIEHLLFRGGTLSLQEINQRNDELGGYLTAVTGGEHTEVTGLVLERDLERELELMAVVVLGPDFASLDEERGVVLAEIIERDDDYEIRADRLVRESLLPNHPLARPRAGRAAELKTIGREDLRGHHHNRYNAQSLVLAAVGAVDLERLTKTAQPFAAAPQGELPLHPPFQPRSPLTAFQQKPSSGYLVRLAGPGRPRQERDWSNPILNAILSRLDSARLTRALRHSGLVYDVSSYSYSYQNGGLIQVDFTADEEKLERSLAVCLDELERLSTDVISDQEVALARNRLLTQLEISLDDHGSAAELLASRVHAGLPARDCYQDLEMIASITTAEIRELAKLFRPERLSLLCVGPDELVWQRALGSLDRSLPALGN
jgi:predicted Zn-dependent peptidase